MQHRNVSPEAMDLIFKNAAWGSLGIKLTPDVAKVDEAKQEDKKEEVKAPVTESKETVAEKHVCPLCESELKEAIADERLMEHTKKMVEVLTEAEDEMDSDEEVDEDEDEVEEFEVDDEDLEDEEVEEEE